LDAKTKEDVYQQLIKCEKFSFRNNIAQKSRAFAIENFDTQNVYLKLKKAIEKYIEDSYAIL
jgi:hypothetical protein